MPPDRRQFERRSPSRVDASRALNAYMRRFAFVVPRTTFSDRPGSVSPDPNLTLPAVNTVRSSARRPISLEDERGMRALAKEIRRLISEDTRRGIGV